ncbi:MAG: (Fe-S)-binding protein [Promethearchaeota archaeon]|nr:MAG: (Fe-S)-binding protein [Candidatus Lokiarchaeota archaeon]
MVFHLNKKIKYPEDRKDYPTEEVDPDNFYSDEEVIKLIKDINRLKFKQDDYYKVYNCVDCGLCDTEMERIQLKEEFIKQGFRCEGLDDMKKCFEKFRTPYPTNKMRIKAPEGISQNSDTLVFMGCLSTIRIPNYTEHALQYLLKNKIDFTILDEEICCGWPWFVSGSPSEYESAKKENIEIFKNYTEIICLCPACYYLYRTEYKKEMGNNIDIKYIADFLKPTNEKKSGTVGFQHLCQVINRGREDMHHMVTNIFKKSGYSVVDIPHWCCGGGIGYMHRTDVIDAIANKRMKDFDRNDLDYVTTYCVSCWWILSRFGKKNKIHPEIKDIFELLS